MILNENDNQPEDLSRELNDYNHRISHTYPKEIPLLFLGETLKCRQVLFVLQLFFFFFFIFNFFSFCINNKFTNQQK